MATWDDIMKELGDTPTPIDYIRRKYIKELSDYTGRNTIAYYSGFVTKSGSDMEINDGDMEGFMNAVRGLDYSKGLDLILHTPGGDPTAAEAIVYYLRDKFNNDIRAIVPQIAMSAGTMIACSAKEIIMGKHSSLGPIDPQFLGIPAHNIKQEFEEAKADLAEHPENVQYWAIKLQQYPAAFMKTAIDAIELSEELIRKWLNDMLEGNKDDVDIAVKFLCSHEDSKVHARHYSYRDCVDNKLRVSLLENDDKLQDKVLSLHHSFMVMFQHTNAVKAISNNIEKDFIVSNN